LPDIIVAHPGWGEALFMKDVFPQAKLVIYCEYYYAIEGQDVGFGKLRKVPMNEFEFAFENVVLSFSRYFC
jgi:hypothetical protein